MPAATSRSTPPRATASNPTQVPNASYEKGLFERKLQELGLAGDFSRQVLQDLGDSFTLDELRASRQSRRGTAPRARPGKPRPWPERS